MSIINNCISFDDAVSGIMGVLRKQGLVSDNIFEYQEYVAKHKVAFSLLYSKIVTGDSSNKHYRHDTDKFVLFSILTKDEASVLHKKYSRHHYPNFIGNHESTVHAIVDYECARITKENKQYNAYESVQSKGVYNEVKSILRGMGLDSPVKIDLSSITKDGLSNEFYVLMIEQLEKDLKYLQELLELESIDNALKRYDESMEWD